MAFPGSQIRIGTSVQSGCVWRALSISAWCKLIESSAFQLEVSEQLLVWDLSLHPNPVSGHPGNGFSGGVRTR